MKTFIIAKFDSYENTNTIFKLQGVTEEEAVLAFLHKEGWQGDTVDQILREVSDFYYSEVMELV